MRAVLQRATRAEVRVDGEVVGRLDGPGLVVLVGITPADGPAEIGWLARKIAEVRILDGERSVAEAGAGVLLISQFTLYGDVRKGRRPSWSAAAPAAVAEPVFEALTEALTARGIDVRRGVFGAGMEVELVNDGPVTLVLDTAEANPS